jgi:glycosyltransferase involved in cell wall biosynthesis/peptidoglycan/xylan/chitin deacetylase (PgdA/CDA1 family)
MDRRSFELIVVRESDKELNPSVFEACDFRVSILSYERPHGYLGHSAGPMRNMGIRRADAERLVFVDSDCMLAPSALALHASTKGSSDKTTICGIARELPATVSADRIRTYSHEELLVLSARDPREILQNGLEPAHTLPATWREFYTCNASAPRSLVIKAGLFDEAGYRCHDLDLGYRLHLAGAEFLLDIRCEVIHLEHPRSIWFREDQIRGWTRIADKHPELRALALDKTIEMQRSLGKTLDKAEAHFTEITRNLPGVRCASTWVFPEMTPPRVVRNALLGIPFERVVRRNAIELFLRMAKNCWDYSFLLPDPFQRPMVSVVTAAHNAERTIRRAVESVLRQTAQSFELIVVDDGCTDLTTRMLTPYASSKRLRVLTNDSNRGLAHALNRALDNCRGTFFLQLDADDWLEPGALEEFVDAFHRHPEVGAIYGAPRIHRKSGGQAYVSRLETGFPVSTPLDCLGYSRLQAPRIYRVNALKAIGGWKIDDAQEGRFFEDRTMLASIAERHKLLYLPEPLYNVVERDESLSRKTPLRAASTKLAILYSQAGLHGKLLSYSFAHGLVSVKQFLPVPRTEQLHWSIVIPFHGASDPVLLILALKSWLESDLRDRLAEIIVVVDGPSPALDDVELPAVEPLKSPTVRFVRRSEHGGPGAARNTGARLAKFQWLFFSDSDRIVPPNVLQLHEARHAGSPYPALVVGDIFGRRTFSVVPQNLSPTRKRRLLEIVRFQAGFFEIAERLIRGERIELLGASSEDVWNAAQRFAFTDAWQSRWGEILLQYGEDLKYFPHKWLRVGSGSLSMARSTFENLDGFDETGPGMEDWEFGVRAQAKGYNIFCAPEAEPLHQIHQVLEERVQSDKLAVRTLAQKHPEAVEHLCTSSPELIPPGGHQFVSAEASAKHEGVRLETSVAPQDQADNKEFVVSFDDGPHYHYSNLVLDALEAASAPGIFFVLGSRLKRSIEVLRRIAQEKHEIGVHGWHHRRWSSLTREEVKQEMLRTIGLVEDTVGSPVKYCRPPYGMLPEHAADALSDLGLIAVGWHLSSRDWLGLTISEIIVELATHEPGGKVFLFHDGYGAPAAVAGALQWLVPALGRAGLRSVPLSAFLERNPVPKCNLWRGFSYSLALG